MARIVIHSDNASVNPIELTTKFVDFKPDSPLRRMNMISAEDFQQEVWEAILEVVLTEQNLKRKRKDA